MKYIGLEFPVAKNIFVNDGWLSNFTTDESKKRWIKFSVNGDNYVIEKPRRASNAPETKKDHILMNDAPEDYESKETRLAITEADLASNESLLRLFLFSVNSNKGPYDEIKKNIKNITANLLSARDKKTYKHYVGHVAWLKANAWSASSDALTVALFAMEPAMEINGDNINKITFNHTDPYYHKFADFVADSSQHTPQIKAGLAMDLANFELYYDDITSRGRSVSRMSMSGLHSRRHSRKSGRSTRSPRKKTMRLSSSTN